MYDYDATEAFQDVVEGIISDYIRTGCEIADTGAPDGLDGKTWTLAIRNVRWLHLAEPNLPASRILAALKLAGWTAPKHIDHE
jgi:hypothetical protein